MEDRYMSLNDLSEYSGLSVRKLRSLIKASLRPVPYHRIGGKILVKKSEYDEWAENFRERNQADVDRIVEEIIGELTD